MKAGAYSEFFRVTIVSYTDTGVAFGIAALLEAAPKLKSIQHYLQTQLS